MNTETSTGLWLVAIILSFSVCAVLLYTDTDPTPSCQYETYQGVITDVELEASAYHVNTVVTFEDGTVFICERSIQQIEINKPCVCYFKIRGGMYYRLYEQELI